MAMKMPAKGATCAVATSAKAARKKIKARGDRLAKGTSLKKAKIGGKTAYCTKVKTHGKRKKK